MGLSWVQGGYFTNDGTAGNPDISLVNYTGGGTALPNTALVSAVLTVPFVTIGLNPIGVGNNVCVIAGGYPNPATIALTDDKGTVYTRLSNCDHQSNTYGSSIFYATNITTAPTKFFITFNGIGFNYVRLLFDEFTPQATLDQFAKNQDLAGTGTCTSGNVTTVAKNEFIWGACADSFFGAHTNTSGGTLREINSHDFVLTSTQPKVLAGTALVSYTTGVGQNSWTYILTFYEASALTAPPWVAFPQ